MSTESVIAELAGKDLAGFKIVIMSEVQGIDDDGRVINYVGFLQNPHVIKVFTSIVAGSSGYYAKPKLILTNGVVFYVLDDTRIIVPILDEISELRKRREDFDRFSRGDARELGLKLLEPKT